MSDNGDDKPQEDTGAHVERFGPVSYGHMASPVKDMILVMQARKRALARTFVIEFLLYIAFLTVFMIVTYNFRSSWAYWNSENIRNGLLRQTSVMGFGAEFATIQNIPAFWLWMEDAFFPNYYPTAYTSGKPFTDYDSQFVADSNLRLGRMRFKQVRVMPESSCPVDPALSGYVMQCYPTIAEATVATEPFGPGNSSAWIYRDADQLCGDQKEKVDCSIGQTGQKSENVYPPGGYAIEFPNNLEGAMKELKYLKDNSWVDVATRAVVIDFTLMNPNIFLIMSVRMVVEFYPTGQLITSSSVKPVPILTLEMSSQWYEFIGEIILGLFVCGYLSRELQEFYNHKKMKKKNCTKCVKNHIQSNKQGNMQMEEVECYICGRHFDPFQNMHCPLCQREIEMNNHICWKGYFQDFWNLIDLANLAVFIVVLVMRFVLRGRLWNYDFDVGDGYLNFYPVAFQYYMGGWLNSFNSLLSFLKAFKYLARSKSLQTCLQTLAKAGDSLLYFVIIFMIIFTGFAMSFHMAFGGDVLAFNHWVDSFYTLFILVMGEFDYYDLQKSNRYLGPIFFFSYLCLVWLVLVNMFVAIVVGSYDTVAEEVAASGDDFLSSSLKLFFRDFRMKHLSWLLGRNNSLARVQRLLTALEKVPTLSEKQREELRALRRELDHSVSTDGLLAKILNQLPNRPELIECTHADFVKLRSVVLSHKQYSQAEKYKTSTFEEDEYDALVTMMNSQDIVGGGGTVVSAENFNAVEVMKMVYAQHAALQKTFQNVMLNVLEVKRSEMRSSTPRSSSTSATKQKGRLATITRS